MFEAEGCYRVGDGSFNPHQGLLLIPDGSTDDADRTTAGVRRFELHDDGTLEALDVIEIDPVLRVRDIRAL